METPRVGRKHFPQTLPLAPKEIVLTFDDGPGPSTQPILTILQNYGVPATFFNIGINANARPALVRAEATIGAALGRSRLLYCTT